MTSEEFRKTKAYKSAIKFMNAPSIPGVLLDSDLERKITFDYHRAVLAKYFVILNNEFVKEVTNVPSSTQG